MINHIVKKRIKYVVFFFWVFLFCFIAIRVHSYTILSFRINGPTSPYNISVFWDHGNEDYPFDETAFTRTIVDTVGEQKLHFIIPSDGFNHLRIDFGDYPAAWEISSFTLTRFPYSTSVTQMDFYQSLGYQNEIVNSVYGEDWYRFSTNGTDSFFVMSNFNALQPGDDFLSFVIYLLAIFLCSLLAYIFLFKTNQLMGILRKIVSNLRSILTTSCNWIKNNKVRLIKFFKWAMLTLVFCYFYISYSRVTVEFEVSINSEEQDAVYLFYDNNSFEYPFDDEHLYTFKNIGVDYQQVTARIPRYAVYKIRIDFGSRAGTYCLKNLKMIFPHKIYTFSADDILRLFSNSGDISVLEKVTDAEMRIQVTGGDGNIYATNSLKGLQSRFNVVCILGCVISGILAWGIMEYQKTSRLIRTAVDKIRQKVKIPQKIKALIFSKKSMVTAAIFLIIVIEIYTFASRMPFYSYDSSWYITYLDYFIGKKPITEWDPIRGFTFPLLLWFAYLLQPGSMGILAMLCCSYVIFSVYAFKILNLINQYCFNRSTSIGDCILLTLLLLFNPIIWSYYHLVLTECIAVTALFIYVYYAFKFYINRIQGTLSIMKYVFFVIFTGLMTIFCYFLKQNFLAITVFIIFISEFLILIKFRTKREFAYSLILVFCTVITLKTSISIWNNVIDYNTSEISAGFLQNIGRLRYFYPLDSQAGVTTISVRDNNYNEIDTFEYQFDDRFINRINFILVCFMKYPNRVLTGYLDNYLLMADLYQNKSWNGVTSYGPVTKGEPLKTLFSDFRIKSAATENKTLAVKSLYSVYYDSESYINTHIQHFKELNMYSEVLEKYKGRSTVKMQNMTTDFLTNDFVMKLCFVIYAIVFVCAPFLLIYFLHLYLKEKTIKSFFFTIITFYAVAFVLLHVAVGNVIDRYALPAYAILLYTPFLCVNRMKLKIQTYKIIITKKE